MMDAVKIGRDDQPAQNPRIYRNVGVYPYIHHHPDGIGYAGFGGREVKDIITHQGLGHGEQEQVRGAGARAGEPPELVYGVMENMGKPEQPVAVHAPVHPIQAEIRGRQAEQDPGGGGQAAHAFIRKRAGKAHGVENGDDQRLPELPGKDHHEQRRQVKAEFIVAVHREARMTAFHEVQDKDHDRQSSGLIDYFFAEHVFTSPAPDILPNGRCLSTSLIKYLPGAVRAAIHVQVVMLHINS